MSRVALLWGLATVCGMAQVASPVNFANSGRVHELIRAGNLYLSLQDALALAIENNLDIELQRYSLKVANTEMLRTAGGGLTRGLSFTIAEAPAGVGGPLGPVVTSRAAGEQATTNSAVSANAVALSALSGSQTNLSIGGSVGQSTGTAIPGFDPAVVGTLNWTHQTTPQVNLSNTGLATLVTNTTIANAAIQQGFASGASASFGFYNDHQWANSFKTGYNPFTASTLGLTVTQPLLRGFGNSLNRRFIRIAANEQRIGSLVFRQQLIATVYGVVRLYTDLVALYEDQKVKEETVKLSEKLYADVKAQVEEGTLAPVELTRANAQIFSTRQDLINAVGLREEQEAILKAVLTRLGHADPEVRAASIIPTDTLNIPDKEAIQPVQDLMSEALSGRPDVAQAGVQIQNSRIGLEGTKNALRPEVDLVGILQNNGAGGPLNPFGNGGTDGSFANGYGGALGQILTRKYPTYGIGVQVSLPIKNRVAEADLARDELQVKQSEIRLRQLENQARLEVEDALIAMRRARASYEASVQARILQQESLAAEQAKFEAGASTSFFVIQYASLLAQARSTEVVAKSSYMKARAALDRATGGILERHNVEFDSAVKGR